MDKLSVPIHNLSGVGEKTAQKFERLGIKNIRDLLFYFPKRYEDFSRVTPIKFLKIGEDYFIRSQVKAINENRTRKRWMSVISALLEDDSGQITAVWFNQPYIKNVLKENSTYYFKGKVRYDFKSKTKQIYISQFESEPVVAPIYGETEGLTSKMIHKLVYPFAKNTQEFIVDYLPQSIKKSESLINLEQALRDIHLPQVIDDTKAAQERLGFDELFFIALKMLSARNELDKSLSFPLKIYREKIDEVVKTLPYELTSDQKKVLEESLQDLSKNRPTNRMIQGDVGSGKTIVALLCAYNCVLNNYQAVYLAPTEILARQQYESAKQIFGNRLKIGLLTSSNKMADTLKDELIFGTHALIQKNIKFKKLALIVIDEQHRFGVKQRAHLRTDVKNQAIAHLISMTATPIPRTMALAVYGDLDLSVIRQMPQNRKIIKTRIVEPFNRQKAYDFIAMQIHAGRQAFVICPLILQNEEKENLFDDKKTVVSEYEKLSKKIFPKFRVGMLHGKMKSKEKVEIMNQFRNKQLDILISTAVVEVGVDIPDATVMMIEDAERFGLAQLHQFRGRVGRSHMQSFCLLFTSSSSPQTLERLEAMNRFSSGFDLSEVDLKLRGPGELIGFKQSGMPDLKMALLTDSVLVEKAKKSAQNIISKGLKNFPELLKNLQVIEESKHLE